MTDGKMPEWPVRFRVDGMNIQQSTESWLEYERALAAAWAARCRVAVQALETIYSRTSQGNRTLLKNAVQDIAYKAMDAIGELPTP